MLVLYAGLVALTAWRVMDTPRGFVPVQDQSTITISITMPPGSSLARTDAIVQRVVPIVLDTPGVSSASVYSGMDGITFSPSTSSGQMWAILDPFEQRMPKGQTAQSIAAEIRKRLAPIIGRGDPHRACPPPVRGLGNAAASA